MKPRIWIIPALFLALLGATGSGLYLTRDTSAAEEATPAKPSAKANQPRKERRVDQRPLQTARALLPLATTPEEKALARQAERLANHDVDLAFTEALRQALEAAPAPSPELRALQEARDKAEAAVTEAERSLKRMKALEATAKGEAQDQLADKIEVTQAQLELAKDELEQAEDDLERAGGDTQARIKRLKTAHEAADKESLAMASQVQPVESLPGHSLLAKLRAWNSQRTKQSLLRKAQADALLKVQRLSQRQQTILASLKESQDLRATAKQQASLLAESANASKGDRQEAAYTLQWFAQEQRKATVIGSRAKDERELAETYGVWIGLVEGYQRSALNALLSRLFLILAVVAGVFSLSWLAEHFLTARTKVDLRAGTHLPVVKVVLWSLGTLVIGFVVVGLPAQATTVLGLMGAGLTVALKDFIVAFFGWFILMGKNGIRVGDWVEIKGVGGEVVEVGLLRTIILETGSWNDSGHPTGRRVAFTNSFAMEGHYFNFSTSGQWMWDELKVQLAPGQDPYPILAGVQRLVEDKTQVNAAQAEKEWRQVTSRYRVQAFSAKPGLQVVPTSAGIEIRARYITRPFERHETRRELYQAVVELMHGKA